MKDVKKDGNGEIDVMYSVKLGDLAFDIENGCAVRFRRITPVAIPEWDCQADNVNVTCAWCGHRFCPGCTDECPACGSKEVIRDKRWDEEEEEGKGIPPTNEFVGILPDLL